VAGHAVLVQERSLRIRRYSRGGGGGARATGYWCRWRRGLRRSWSRLLGAGLGSCRGWLRPGRLGLNNKGDEQCRDAAHDK